MTDIPQAAWDWAAKGAGALAGSAISLAFALPRGRREAALRFFVGVVSGVVFGSTIGLKIAVELDLQDKIGATETLLIGAASASFCAWWALGFVKRLFEDGKRR